MTFFDVSISGSAETPIPSCSRLNDMSVFHDICGLGEQVGYTAWEATANKAQMIEIFGHIKDYGFPEFLKSIKDDQSFSLYGDEY